MPHHLAPTPPRWLSAAGLAAILVLAGCRTIATSGSSTMEMLEPIPSPQAKTDRTAEIVDAIVINDIPPSAKGELAKPLYPAAVLAARYGLCVVNVTITIDTTGQVTEVSPSWQRLNIPGPFADEFLAAIRTAVSTWRFEPARYVYWEKAPDGELTYLDAAAVPAKTDIKFTFEATGHVR